jgi:uncharacterized membrane protein YcaP (DUF421 family)
MHELFTLSAPWWVFVLRAVAVYALVMLLVRLSGKRAVGQFTPFDLVLLILVGNAVQNGMNGGDNSLSGAVILAVSLMLLNYAVAWLTARSRAVERVVEGAPVVLAHDGVVYDAVLAHELVSEDDFREAMRLNNIASVDEIGLALLETNGNISVLSRHHAEAVALQRPHRRRRRRPASPSN